MLKTATIQELIGKQITKRQGHIVVATRYYPRGLSKELIHEYNSSLAPSKALLSEFKNTAKKSGHNSAFKFVGYTRRFEIDQFGLDELKRLSELSRAKDVYLACYCGRECYCHRDLLLLMAQALYAAPIEKIKQTYPSFDPRRQG
jgi:uncharacterized protein YeaO (DUF488 family)